MPRTITIFVCLLITVILIFTLVLPKKTALDLSEKKIEEKTAEIQGKEEYFSNLARLSEELKDYQDPFSKIASALPEDPGFADLFDFLQKSASQSGLVLTTITILPSPVSLEKEKPEFQETKIDLSLSGNYSAFKNFLSILEKSARLIEVESFTLSAELKEELFKFDLKIKVYSYW